MGTHGGRWHLLDCLLDGEWDPLAMEGPGKATWRVLNLRNNPPNLFHPNSASPAPQAVFSGPSCFMPCVQPKATLAPPNPPGQPSLGSEPQFCCSLELGLLLLHPLYLACQFFSGSISVGPLRIPLPSPSEPPWGPLPIPA